MESHSSKTCISNIPEQRNEMLTLLSVFGCVRLMESMPWRGRLEGKPQSGQSIT